MTTEKIAQASILIHLDFLSIYNFRWGIKVSFNASILIHLDFLSISPTVAPTPGAIIASILIHLDFLSIYNFFLCCSLSTYSFNPYSPGFSIYFVIKKGFMTLEECFNPYSPGFSIYLADLSELEDTIRASILIHLDFLSI